MWEKYLNLDSVTKRFKEVVLETRIIKLASGEPAKLRIEIVDGSFADIWLSASGKYSYHWDRLEIDGTLYRFDNAPHRAWEKVTTFPHHFHNRYERNVFESIMPSTPEMQMEYFMDFIKKTLVAEGD